MKLCCSKGLDLSSNYNSQQLKICPPKYVLTSRVCVCVCVCMCVCVSFFRDTWRTTTFCKKFVSQNTDIGNSNCPCMKVQGEKKWATFTPNCHPKERHPSIGDGVEVRVQMLKRKSPFCCPSFCSCGIMWPTTDLLESSYDLWLGSSSSCGSTTNSQVGNLPLVIMPLCTRSNVDYPPSHPPSRAMLEPARVCRPLWVRIVCDPPNVGCWMLDWVRHTCAST